MTLAKTGAIPSFYWEASSDFGNSIDGTPIPLSKIVNNFPVCISGHRFSLTFNQLDQLRDDVVLGSYFLDLVMPVTIDNKALTFSCCLNGFKLTCPMSLKGISRCKNRSPKPQKSLKDRF